MLRKIRLVIGLGALVVIGGAAGISYMFGNGTVTVVAPLDKSVAVTVDGKASGNIAQGGHLELSLKQGKHAVELVAEGDQPTKWDVDVKNGAFDQLLPVGNQCFAVFDVTNLIYEKTSASASSSAVVVTNRFKEMKPVDMPSNVYFELQDVPKTIKEHEHVSVLYDMPCDTMAAPDTALITAAALDQ